VSELQVPLSNFIRETAHAVVEALGLEKDETIVQGIANRWQNGTLVLRPADASVQAKEVPLETFFHKIVMIRNNLRVLEQKVNASDKLSDADKFELQQYITRCYGSLTTFNILFKKKEDQFSSAPSQRPRHLRNLSGSRDGSSRIFVAGGEAQPRSYSPRRIRVAAATGSVIC
jgi:hypothetical protein